MATDGADTGSARALDSRTGVEWTAALLAAVTGAIHLSLGVRVIGFVPAMGSLFVLAGLGFFAGIAAFLSRFWRRELYLAAAGYAALQITLWLWQGQFDALGYVDKAVQASLVALALYLYRESGS